MSSWSARGLRRWNEAARGCFVGRGRECAELRAAWDAARRGARQVRFVGGEPGAGKSRLLAQLVSQAAEGATVLGGTCPSALASPYEPFVGPVATLRSAIADGDLPLVDGGAPAVRTTSGDVARTLGHLDTVTGVRPAGRASRRDLLDAVVTAVRSAAEIEPVLLALDDLHWAGESAWELLTFLVEQTQDVRLLVVATRRTTPGDRTDHAVRQVAALARLDGVGRVDLPPLETDAVADLLVHEAAVPSGLAEAVADRVRDRTGGNAYFVRELVQTLAARGPSGFLDPDAATPLSVQDAVVARLGGLDPGARATVELAAVIGDVVDEDLLVTASGEVPPGDVLGHLDAARAAHLIEPVDGILGTARFRHAIAREVVLATMPAARLAGLNLAVARALEVQGGHGAARAAQLAHHWEAAHVLGHREPAVDALRCAAALAAEGLAHDESAGFYERAAAIDDDRTRADDAILLAAHERLLTGGVVRAWALAEPVADDPSSPHRLRAAVQYEDARWRTAVTAGRSVELLRAALDAPGDHDEALRVRALAGLGRALVLDGEDDEGRALITRAIARARELGDDGLLVVVLVASLVLGSAVVEADVKLARAEEITERCLRTHDPWLLGPAASYRTLLGYQKGDPGLVHAGLVELRHAVEETRQPYFAHLAGCVDFSRHLAAGRLDRAAQVSERLLAVGTSLELDVNVGPDGQYGVQQFVLRRERGSLDDARAFVSDDDDLAERWAPGLLALYTELGMHTAARRALRWLLDPETADAAPGTRAGVLTILADAAVVLGDQDAARQIRASLAPYSGLNLMFGSLVSAMGSADRYLGSLDALLGTDGWEQSFARAEAMDRRMEAHLHVAHTLAAHALTHVRTGAGGCDVAALADEARSIATAVGSQRVLRMLRGVDGARGRRADGLTGREVEVLRLVARGCSNREVARSLVISEHTAANHVRSILFKTGCENRTRAARYAADEGLLD